jgi:hypothetical protein
MTLAALPVADASEILAEATARADSPVAERALAALPATADAGETHTGDRPDAADSPDATDSTDTAYRPAAAETDENTVIPAPLIAAASSDSVTATPLAPATQTPGVTCRTVQ